MPWVLRFCPRDGGPCQSSVEGAIQEGLGGGTRWWNNHGRSGSRKLPVSPHGEEDMGRRVIGSRRLRVEVWSDGAKQCDADLDLIKLEHGAAAPPAPAPVDPEFHATLHADRVLLIDLAGAGTLTFRAQG